MSRAIREEATDPIGYFIEDLRHHGKSERTLEAYARVLSEFGEFLESGGHAGGSSIHFQDATHRDCTAWLHSRRGSYAPSTIATYASYLHRFYDYMMKAEVFGANPMSLVLEEMNESIQTDPSRRDLTVDEMRAFVRDLNHPLDRAVIVTLLKTGIRAGELCNLDLRDLAVTDVDSCCTTDWEPRAQLSHRPNSLFLSPEPTAGITINGEERTVSNKRKRESIIPVDDELQSILVDWLAIRPDSPSPAAPLFMSTSSWGKRLTPNMVHHIVTTHSKRVGWYESGAGPEENVTPHYFRHFFTTHLRDRTGDRGIVKYLRGDVADDVIDTYTHNWRDRVREIYEATIYSLL